MPNDDSTSLRSLGLALREIRKQRELTQEELAERAHIHVAYVSGIERGTRSPSWKAVDSLLVALGCPVEEFGVVYDEFRLDAPNE